MSRGGPAVERWGKSIGADVTRGGGVDACVIGSGAGGGPVALQLARAGYRVLVLEKGPALDQRDFLYDEIRSCRRDLFVPAASDEPHVMVAHGRAHRTTNGWTANCLGGGTVHFGAYTYRLHPDDLRLRSLLGDVEGAELVDWPIGWEQLLPYYELAEVELGISGDARRNPFERFRRPLPLGPLRENGIARLIDKVCSERGLHPYPTARAILSRPWQGRSVCRYSHFCANYGCETGAKSSSLAALLPRAVATKRCQLRPLAMAEAIETDAGGRATAVRYIDASGARQRVRAALVVVACSAVESARLLLHSRGAAHPQGIGNQHDQLGRRLMFTGLGTAEADFPVGDPRIKGIDWREPFINRSYQDFYLLKEGRSVTKLGTVSFLFPHRNPIYTAERLATAGGRLLWGKPLKDALRRWYREVRTVEFEIFVETLPRRGSRVVLDDQVKDRWGLPVARMIRERHPQDIVHNSALLDRGLQVLRDLGGQHVRATRRGGESYWLQAGTCRFGKDPKTSVLDPDCRVHTAPNVFVTDGSFMPTSGGVPNTLTIEANAFRVADRIIALGKAHSLDEK